MTESLITSIARAAELDREAADRLEQIMKAAPVRPSRKAPVEPPTWITKSTPRKAAANKPNFENAVASSRQRDDKRANAKRAQAAREKAERNKL